MAMLKRSALISVNIGRREPVMSLLPEMTDDERKDAEHDRRLEEALAEAQAAQQRATETMKDLARTLGFPMTRSVRLLEEDRATRRD